MGWNCNATYYADYGSGWLNFDAGLGYLVGNMWSNNYSGYSSSYAPSGKSVSPAYSQIVYVAK